MPALAKGAAANGKVRPQEVVTVAITSVDPQRAFKPATGEDEQQVGSVDSEGADPAHVVVVLEITEHERSADNVERKNNPASGIRSRARRGERRSFVEPARHVVPDTSTGSPARRHRRRSTPFAVAVVVYSGDAEMRLPGSAHLSAGRGDLNRGVHTRSGWLVNQNGGCN
jgi:hypothetical protein